MPARMRPSRVPVAVVGEQVVAQFRRYLASSEIQFRTRVVTNYRLILRRRPGARV